LVVGTQSTRFRRGIDAWLKSSHVHTLTHDNRIAVVFLTASFLSSFANILAYGLTQIASNPELGGWKWIFIIEGIMTIVLAVIAYFAVIDFPDSRRNTFLSTEEVEIVNARLIRSRGTLEGGQVTWRVVREAASSWHVWTIGTIYMSGSCAVYSYLFFLPIILRRGLGYSQKMAFLLTAPPAAVAIVYVFALSWMADKYRVRGPFILLHCTLGITGLCMIGFLDSATPRYIGTFLGQCGGNGLIVTGLAWGQNNVRADARRSVVTAIFVMMAGVGGIYSALVFRQVVCLQSRYPCCHLDRYADCH
jgi:hypothetical protein